MFIVLLGVPGAGKGTQAKALSHRFDIPHFSTGRVFRSAVLKQSLLGSDVRQYLERGLLIPDEVTNRVVYDALADAEYKQGAILDGYPRTVQQARGLQTYLESNGKFLTCIFHIVVDPKEALKRLRSRTMCRNCEAPYNTISHPSAQLGKCDECGGQLFERADDDPAIVQEKLNAYAEQTLPVVDYFRQAGQLLEIDGQKGINEISKRLFEFAYSAQAKHTE